MAWGLPFFSRSTAEVADPAAVAFDAERATWMGYQNQALELARRTAASEIDPATGQPRQPNLTDYFRSALTIPELANDPQRMANLSGLTLDGFTIRKEDLQPTPDQARANLGDMGIRGMRNFIDADGNGQIEVEHINEFYRDLQSNLRFNGTQFHNVTFQPATTLEIFNNAVGAQFANITLDGLNAGETLTIGTDTEGNVRRETFSNVRLINDQGGTIKVAGNATLNGLSLDNGMTRLEIAGGGQVNQLHVNGETMSLKAQPQSQMFLPSFENATFTPDSTMAGATLRGNTMDDRFYGFRNSNLNGMSFERGNLSGITFENSDLTGANMRYSRLSDCVIRDTNIASIDFTGASIQNLTIERGGQTIRIDSLEQLQNYQRQENVINAAMNIGRGMNLNIDKPAPAPDAPAVELRQTPTAALMAGPAPLPAPSAVEPVRAVSGGDTPVNEAPKETIARLGGALGQYQPAVDATLNDVKVSDQAALNSQEARLALAQVLESKAQAAMDGYTRGDGRGNG